MSEPLTEAEIVEIEQWPEVEHDTPIMRLIATIRSLRAENEGGQSLSRSLSTRLNEVKAENERLTNVITSLDVFQERDDARAENARLVALLRDVVNASCPPSVTQPHIRDLLPFAVLDRIDAALAAHEGTVSAPRS